MFASKAAVKPHKVAVAMSKIKPDATQARRNDPADEIISDARKPYMLHALQVMIRRRYRRWLPVR